MSTFYHFSTQLSERLLSWSGFSMASGGMLASGKDPFWRGVGVQFFGWGFIDALIALFGWVNTRKNSRRPNAHEPEMINRERRNLRRLLWINTGLDVFYVLGGFWLLRRKGKTDPNWRGQGVGIIIQGGFLFVFDLWHALKLKD